MALHSVTSRTFVNSGLQSLPIRKKFKATHEISSVIEQPLDFSVKSNEPENTECLHRTVINDYQNTEIEMDNSNVLNLSNNNLSNHYGWSKVQQQVKTEPQYSQQFSSTMSSPAHKNFDNLIPYMGAYSSPPETRHSTSFPISYLATTSTPRTEAISKILPIVEVHNTTSNTHVDQSYVHEYCPMNSYPTVSGIINAKTGGKSTRPFKAYPRDPLAISYGICNTAVTPEIAATGALISQASNEAYVKFRQQMLNSVKSTLSKKTDAANKNSPAEKPTTSVDERQKYKQETSSDDSSSSQEKHTAELDKSEQEKKSKGNVDGSKDQSYWERRRKNNEAAKRSRDARRAKEDEIAIRAAFLEQENVKLRMQIAFLQDEVRKLRSMI